MMASVSSRLLELLRNLKSDAVPSQPRPESNCPDSTQSEEAPDNENPSESYEPHIEDDDDHEEIVFGQDDFIKEEKKPKFKFPFKPKKNKDDPKDPGAKSQKKNKRGSFSSVNTQATGTVFNVVNSNGVQFGSNHVYHISSGDKYKKETKQPEEHIEKNNLIILLMESEIQPTHKYIDFVAKNLGVNWQAFFITLGYLKGRIETLVMEEGITEARYKLLLDWVNNNDDATLGRLASVLWEEGERPIVQGLSIIYKENKNK